MDKILRITVGFVLALLAIGVSSEMCLDCQEYFKALVRHTGNIQVIADPKIVRIFYPNGNVDELSNVSDI
ncbi:MAG: hypothetical protein H0X31_04910 [Nostocaceae cyanobacterium]|nr:hypothetical protein [Nostocaceae cyanobacterium]